MSEYFSEKMSNRIQTANIQMHPKDIHKTSKRLKKTTQHIQKTSKTHSKDTQKTPKTHPEHIQNLAPPFFEQCLGFCRGHHHCLTRVWDFVEGNNKA